jgi:hypothetical protein
VTLIIATSDTASRRTYYNIPTAEFGMISAKTDGWDIERKKLAALPSSMG